MSTIEKPAALAELVRVKARRDTVDLDYLRAARAAAENASQREIARILALSQPAVNKILARAKGIADLRPTFHGATPFEIAQRYSGGFIDRAQVIDELARWPYLPKPKADEFDDVWEPGEGTWYDVEEALQQGLIDGEIYSAAQARRHVLKQ
ncbi:hypothetical protein [Cryobacterium sp. GrIS_2_6]|uniref:hypothetical protein n=1 Tax=Cryobacterium sp. GrIS_2_6 TaxID=3162785 RepID=UPI002E0BF1E5|nr:hypothetical protein [Cryobacterium psychrotolerans]